MKPFNTGKAVKAIKSCFPGLVLFVAVIAIGVSIYKDYGVTWDEISQHNIGTTNVSFISSLDAGIIDNFWDRDHGASFEIMLVWMERTMGATDVHDFIPIRHICTFLFYACGVFFSYLLVLRLYGQQWLAVLTALIVVLQPRLFAHAFFNSKDIPFLVAYVASLYAIFIALERGDIARYAFAGALCGFTAGIRTIGLLLVFLVMALLVTHAILEADARKKHFRRLLWFMGTMIAMLYITWPTLWYHPIDNLVGSLKSLSQFTRFDTNVLFNGKMSYCTDLPWYYAPFWICISTPLLWVLIGICGNCLLFWHLATRRIAILRSTQGQMLLICALSVFIPMLAVIVLQSVVYDDWRHLYFVYPPFIVVGAYALNHLGKSRIARGAVVLACLSQALFVTVDMVRLHPFQQVYFNCLVPRSEEYLRARYDLEYWGASYKQGFEYLLTHVPAGTISVVNIHTPHTDNWLALPEQARRRIKWAPESESGAYLMTNFRVHPEDYPYRKVWSIKREGSTIMQIYQIP